MINVRRIGVLKRVLKYFAHLPDTVEGIADREELELMITELGGDARTGAHRAIKESTCARMTQRRLTEGDEPCQSD